MKRWFLFVLSIALLLSLIGCSSAEEAPSEVTPASVAEEEQSYHFSAEVVKYGNDALYVKITDAGDSTLSIGDALYVGVAEGYDNYPLGCTVAVVYSRDAVVDEYGIGRTLSVERS